MSRTRIRLPGHPLPKYGYQLTEEGWLAAGTLRQRLSSRVVTVRAPSLGAMSVRLSEVERIAAAKLDLTGAVASIRKGALDLARPTSAIRGRGPLRWGSPLRRVDRFFGRVEERKRLDRWWDSDSRMLLVTGLAGIGKSALVAAWIQGRSLGVPVYAFEVRASNTAAAFLSDLGAFLAALGKPALATYVAEGVPLDLDFVSRLLRRDLAGERVLLIIDNADQASRPAAAAIGRILLEEPLVLPARMILVGRRVPRWLSRRRGVSRRETYVLQGLEAGASRDLLRARGLGTDSVTIERIVRKTRGHPLLLHLAATAGPSHPSAVQRYLEEEVWESLAAEDRSVLEALSLFRNPASARALEHVAHVDGHALGRLSERNLIERTISGGYVMHDMVREFVEDQMPNARRARYHGRAAALLLHGTDSRERWEGVYHLIRAGRVTEGAALLDSEGATLLDSVAAEDVARLVRSLTLDEQEAATYCVFAEVLGDSLRIRGHTAPALFQYGHARRLAETSGHPERIPRLLRKMAFIERCRNRYPKALGDLVEARARLLALHNPAEMVEILREMALAEQALGNMEEAAHHLNEAIDLATDGSDRAALSRSLLALGSLEARRGHPEAGLELDLEGLRVAERSGNLTETAHGHIVVGAAYTGIGRARESLGHYEKGFEAAQLLGNLRLMAYATMNRTNALLLLQRYSEAGVALREATGYFDTLEEKDTLGFLKTYEGELEMGLGRWSRATRALDEGLALLRSHGSPADLALVLREVAGFYAERGEVGESRSRLLEARDLARGLKDSELASRIDSDLRRLRPVLAGRNRPNSAA